MNHLFQINVFIKTITLNKVNVFNKVNLLIQMNVFIKMNTFNKINLLFKISVFIKMNMFNQMKTSQLISEEILRIVKIWTAGCSICQKVLQDLPKQDGLTINHQLQCPKMDGIISHFYTSNQNKGHISKQKLFQSE